MNNQNKAYLFAITAILCWSTIASAFKYTLQFISFINLLFYGSVTATVVLFILLFVQGKTRLLFKINRKLLINSALRGFLNPFLYYLVLLKAYEMLKAQEAGTLNYIWPITLVLLSIPLLGQRIKLISIAAIIISFTGIIVISTAGRIAAFEFTEPLGVLLAVGSSIFWALYWILNMKDKHDEILKLFLNFCFGSIFIFLAVLLFFSFDKPVVQGIAGSVYAGLFEMGITYFLWLKALKLSENTARVANLVYLSPFISLLIIKMTLGESILWSTVAGLILIVAGILIQQIADRNKAG